MGTPGNELNDLLSQDLQATLKTTWALDFPGLFHTDSGERNAAGNGLGG